MYQNIYHTKVCILTLILYIGMPNIFYSIRTDLYVFIILDMRQEINCRLFINDNLQLILQGFLYKDYDLQLTTT